MMTHSIDAGRALPSAVSACCGLAMAAVVGARGPAGVIALLVAGAVLAGLCWRAASTVAVLLTAVAIAIADPTTISAAVAGLAAVGYLLLRHAADGAETVTAPTVIAAAGFSTVGVAAAAFPLQLPWLPLAGAPAALGCYLLALRPFPFPARRN